MRRPSPRPLRSARRVTWSLLFWWRASSSRPPSELHPEDVTYGRVGIVVPVEAVDADAEGRRHAVAPRPPETERDDRRRVTCRQEQLPHAKTAGSLRDAAQIARRARQGG